MRGNTGKGNYGISIDSTPDISHTDQLTVLFRYVTIDGNVVERFLQFIPIQQRDGKYLFEILQNVPEPHGINMADCRSQSYDNASNTSGIYLRVQARFREVNYLAEWVRCVAHSLNLVGLSAAECCTEAVGFFSILQYFICTTKMGKINQEYEEKCPRHSKCVRNKVVSTK